MTSVKDEIEDENQGAMTVDEFTQKELKKELDKMDNYIAKLQEQYNKRDMEAAKKAEKSLIDSGVLTRNGSYKRAIVTR